MSTRIGLLEQHIEKLDSIVSKTQVPLEVREWLDHAKVLIENHGTRSHYVKGCRHPACIKAEREYQNSRRKKSREAFVQSVLEDDL